MNEKKYEIEHGRTVLGIELGSTRIKSVLTDLETNVLAVGSFEWENQILDGIWTYSLEDVWKGLQGSYQNLKEQVKGQYGAELTKIGAIGISAMQHGYMVFDRAENQLVPFRTWRNTITKEASEELMDLFHYPIAQRWSIAHLYQAVLNGEPHVPRIAFMTTLAGYVHWKLTGRKAVGLNEASGMFPIDLKTRNFNSTMIGKFQEAIRGKGYPWKLGDILPEIVDVGENAGELTEKGARLLDPSGTLEAGIPFCPPEGDGGTGMVATNSIRPCTGNISSGTSVFAMLVLEKELSRVYPEIDQVVTPDGHLVAMVHCNNLTSDLNSWIGLFREFAEAAGLQIKREDIFRILYNKAMEGEPDGGGMLAYNYLSGEHITGLEEGRPMFIRTPESRFDLANFMKTNLYASLGTIKIGMDILAAEGVKVDVIVGHGGFFKTKGTTQKIMADALEVPVKVMATAGEGGAWGIAVLASYMICRELGETLADYLEQKVFRGAEGTVIQPDGGESRGFCTFMERFRAGLDIERTAVEKIKTE